jgi:hypothetical protein
MLIQMRPPRAAPPPPTGQVLIAALLTWLDNAPAGIIEDMKRLHDEREEAAELLSRADALRSELNQQIVAANARDELLSGRESALQKREAAVEKREAALAKLRAEFA